MSVPPDTPDSSDDSLDSGQAEILASGDLGTINFSLDIDLLVDAALSLVRRGDKIALLHLFEAGVDSARVAYENQDATAVSDILDKLTCLGAAFLAYEEDEWFQRVVNSFVDIYDLGRKDNVSVELLELYSLVPQPWAPTLWLLIGVRVFALGALAVRLERWEAVKTLALQAPQDARAAGYISWLKHSLIFANRMHLKPDGDIGGEGRLNFVLIARPLILRLTCLARRLPEDEIFDWLAQFDLLAALLAMHASEKFDDTHFWPHACSLDGERVRPLIKKLIGGTSFRSQFFTLGDVDLAVGLGEYLDRCWHESSRFRGYFSIHDEQIETWLKANHP